MDFDTLEKAEKLKKNIDQIKIARQKLDGGVCVFIGEYRLDSLPDDLYRRITEVISDELNRVEQDILAEILKL